MPAFDWGRLDSVDEQQPLRVLFSACLLGHQTGWEGDAYTTPLAVRLAALRSVAATHFCPEHVSLGTPRPLTTLHDGQGRDVLAGRARVIETTGRDVTRELVAGARQMLDLALERRVELAILTEISDSCGSHALYIGAPEQRRYQQGTGVAAALLLDAGIPVFGHRDEASLGRLLSELDPEFTPDPDARDFVEQDWYPDYFADGPVGPPLADWERAKKQRSSR